MPVWKMSWEGSAALGNELGLVQFIVEAPFCHQGLVGALLYHLAAPEHKNMVCRADGRKPVGDHKAGLACHQGAHCRLDLLFGAGIHVGGGFVQNQHLGIQEHGPGDGQQLLLPLGDGGAIVRKNGVVPLGQPGNEGMDPGSLCRRNHLFHGGPRLSVGDVVKDAALEQPGVLQDHGVSPEQGASCETANILPVYQHLAAVHIVKAHEKIDDGSFTSPGGADDGGKAARLCVEAQTCDNGAPGDVGEVD